MELIKILNYLDKKFPEKAMADWDKSGIQNYGLNLNFDFNQQIKNVFVTMDLTAEAFKKAMEFEADLIITRHPFIFHDLKMEKNNLAKKQIIKGLIAKKIIVYTIHSNYDASNNNDLINLVSKQIPVKKFHRFGENKEGWLIKLKNNVLPNDFFNHWKVIFPRHKFNLSNNWNMHKPISEFYLISGSGGDTITQSRLNNTVVVTGELKWNHWIYSLDNEINVFSVGHEMENHFSNHLALLLKNAYPKLNVLTYNQVSPFSRLSEDN